MNTYSGKLIGAACAALLFTTVAFAGGLVDVLFGNTLHMQIGEAELRGYFEEDGSYSNSAGKSGTWTADDVQVCVVVEEHETCIQGIAGKSVGDSWSETGSDGREFVFTIVAGR